MNKLNKVEVLMLASLLSQYQKAQEWEFDSNTKQSKFNKIKDNCFDLVDEFSEEELVDSYETLGSKIITLFNETFPDDQN